jgi:hypothetical protein
MSQLEPCSKHCNVPNEEQQLYWEIFHSCLGKISKNYEEMLIDYGVYSQSDWKSNCRHALQYLVHSNEDYGNFKLTKFNF